MLDHVTVVLDFGVMVLHKTRSWANTWEGGGVSLSWSCQMVMFGIHPEGRQEATGNYSITSSSPKILNIQPLWIYYSFPLRNGESDFYRYAQPREVIKHQPYFNECAWAAFLLKNHHNHAHLQTKHYSHFGRVLISSGIVTRALFPNHVYLESVVVLCPTNFEPLNCKYMGIILQWQGTTTVIILLDD